MGRLVHNLAQQCLEKGHGSMSAGECSERLRSGCRSADLHNNVREALGVSWIPLPHIVETTQFRPVSVTLLPTVIKVLTSQWPEQNFARCVPVCQVLVCAGVSSGFDGRTSYV
jgi:hypothetical protein